MNKYTTPKLNKNNPDAWYIGFSYNGKSCRFKLDYNRIKDLDEREFKFRTMIASMKIKLSQGDWNPLLKIQNVVEKEKTLIEALDFAIEKKAGRVTESTLYLYGCTLTFLKTAISKLKMDNMLATELNRYSIMMILEETAKNQKSTNKGYNKYLDHFRALLGMAHKWDLIPYNPASMIDYMPFEESNFHNPPTKEELITIVNHLREYHPNFWNFIEFYYYSGRRPDEILQLKIESLNNETIILKPANAKNTGRIKRYQNIVITPQLAEIIQRIKANEYPPSYYLFGKDETANHIRYKSGGDYIPAERKIRIQTATTHWRKIVKERLNLNITMYSFKKLAANHKLLSGVSVGAVAESMGHENIRTAKIYLTDLEQVNRKEIISKAKSIDDFLK